MISRKFKMTHFQVAQKRKNDQNDDMFECKIKICELIPIYFNKAF